MRFDLKSSSKVLDTPYSARPVHRISIWWNTVSHTPWLHQLGLEKLHRTSAGSASSWSAAGYTTVRIPLSALLRETKAFAVRSWTMSRTSRRLALTQSGQWRLRPHMLLSFSWLLCLVLVLIAESWRDWGDRTDWRSVLRGLAWEDAGDVTKVRQPVAH